MLAVMAALLVLALSLWHFSDAAKKKATIESLKAGGMKAVVVTGAASGIGRATVLKLAKTGNIQVFACDLNGELLAEMESIANIHTQKIDITKPVECEQLKRRVFITCAELKCRLAAIVNVAGVLFAQPLLESSDDSLQKSFSVNTIAPIRLARMFCSALLEGGGGHIVNVSSVGGFVAWPWTGPYAATKHALEGATDAMRREALANKLPLKFCLIEPGPVNTPMAMNVIGNGVKWCDENTTSPWAPAMQASVGSAKSAMDSGAMRYWSWIGYTPEQVADKILCALGSSEPKPRYLAVHGIMKAHFYFARYAPTWLGDFAMKSV